MLAPADYELMRSTATVFAARFSGDVRMAVRNIVHLPQAEHCVAYRVKSREAIARKLSLTRVSINDFIGLRVLCAHTGVMADVASEVKQSADRAGLQVVRWQGVEEHRDDSYRAWHLDFKSVDRQMSGLPDGVGVEVQVLTWLQYLVAAMAHDLIYKPQSGHAEPADEQFLRCISSELRRVDEDVERFFCQLFRSLPPSG